MPAFTHTPYDGSHRPFTIGLARLDPAAWIEPDDRLLADLARKDELLASFRDTVFAAEPGTEAVQADVLAVLAGHLVEHHRDSYDRTATGVMIGKGAREVWFAAGDPPLVTAARLVQEDLVLMRRGETGWRLAAAVLCFPSSWSLREKFGRDLNAIHAQVPGYPTMAARMNRIFDNLRAEAPVWRLNWSIYPDDDLHHPEAKQVAPHRFEASRAFVRVERQTLRRLPDSGDILFTIKVLVDPLAALASHPDGARLAMGLKTQLLALDSDQLDYKGLGAVRDLLAARLDALALEPGDAAAM
jgi:dimethylamine monooxygenase subunit A